ncbi:hypothetical protein ASE07_07785 [Noviherbaspirillum sp. Root189]|nr:hypothetical protein ASE07_07785 [Noviherbaspirillum sp. Root189]
MLYKVDKAFPKGALMSPARKKYYVAVSRPVIQSTIIEVEADNEEDAADKAFQEAFALDDNVWSGKFEPENYGHDVVSVLEQDQGHLQAEPEFVLQDRIDDVKYLLLRGDTNMGEGSMLFQPWLQDHSSLFVADVCKGWLGDIQLLADEGVEGLVEWVEDPILDAAKIPPEVIARLPWLGQSGHKGSGNNPL